MTRYFLTFLLLAAFCQWGFAQSGTKPNSPEAVVIRLFEALAELDTAKARACCTSDITLLESGKVWNFDSLAIRISTRKAQSSDFKRVNQFDFIQTRIIDQCSYVSYFNKAAISFNGKTTYVKWLETVVLQKVKNEWKISLLHSTELERTQ